VALRAEIVRPITGRGILADLVLIGHGQCGPRQRARSGGWKRWLVLTEPLEMGLTCVGTPPLRIAMMILGDKGVCEITEPAVIRR
jgi:hypothetical protein